MTPLEFSIVSVVVTGLLLVVARGVRPPREERKSKPERVSRWKTFRLHGPVLRSRPTTASRAVVIEEVPDGVKLLLLDGKAVDRRIGIGEKSGRERIRITRSKLFSRRRLHLRVDDRDLADLLPPARANAPPEVQFVEESARVTLQGNPAKREYELRREGRLVAIVSRHAALMESEESSECLVETLRSESAVPLLALILALEVALG